MEATTKPCRPGSQEWSGRDFPDSLVFPICQPGCFCIFTLSFSAFSTIQRPGGHSISLWPPSQQHLAEVVTFWRWSLDGKMRRWTWHEPCAFGKTADPGDMGVLGVIDRGQLTLRVSFTLHILMPLSYVVIQPRICGSSKKNKN